MKITSVVKAGGKSFESSQVLPADADGKMPPHVVTSALSQLFQTQINLAQSYSLELEQLVFTIERE